MAGLGESVQRVQQRATSLLKLKAELATIEMRRKAIAIGIGAGLALTALVLILFSLGFALAAASSALELHFSAWASHLIVAGAVLVAAALLGLAAVAAFKRGSKPAPTKTAAETRKTIGALRGDARS
jgi:hypothetical protein